jgi:hypothetical protein
MKISSKLVRCSSLAVLCVAAFSVTPASARERHNTFTGAEGKSATRNVSRNQGDVASNVTTADGKVLSSRTVERSPTSTKAQITGPNGQSGSRETTRTATGSSTTTTKPAGQSGVVTVTR